MADLPPGEPGKDRVISRAIAQWFEANARPLPWRLSPRDPWLSLMSEIMLQQTQVARVAERFDAFSARFPTPAAMARASVDDVLAMWSGLGYYRRARMLHACASAIVERHAGSVPDDVDQLHALPGVGRYTAGAVASIAFDKPEPLVDGNVSRVLLRLHGVDQPADGSGVQAWAWERATDLARASSDHVASYSEGVMELGATVCTPRAPSCNACPASKHCRAHELGITDRIPRPKSRVARKPLAISAVVVVDRRGRVLLEPRPAGGLWGGLWQPPCVERHAATHPRLAKTLETLGFDGRVDVRGRSVGFEFATTHRAVTVRVWKAAAGHADRVRRARGGDATWIYEDSLGKLGLGSAQRRMLLAAGIASGGPKPGQSA
ncbi:MAG: A/G-specific adenine glycosylase [Phycisphaera sp.]|nr:MAG: A/G-specific adenine glycosylase [Phycisphaera sp.]